MGCAGSCRWCAAVDRHRPALDRPTVTGFIAALLDGGAEAATARSRHLAVRRFSAWLADEGEMTPTELRSGMSPPKLDTKVDPGPVR